MKILNNTLYIKLITVLLKVQLLLILFLFLLPVFAKPEAKNIKVNSQTIIVNLDINDKLDYDYEVFINPDSSFSLPFKSTAKLMDIPFNQNKLTKEITFGSPDSKSGVIDFQKQKIVLKDKVIDLKKNEKMVFSKNGILEETQDEIFIPVKILNEILETTISQDISNYSVSIKTAKSLNALIAYDEQQNKKKNPFDFFPESNDQFMKIFMPNKKNFFSFDTIKFDSYSQFYSNKQINQLAASKDSYFGSNAQLSLNGSFFDGEYEIKSNPRFMQNNILNQGGFGFGYKKEFKNCNLELGSISGIKLGSFDTGQGVLGININNEKNIQKESGMVAPGSKVNVYVNNKLVSTVNTQGGYYDIQDLSSFSNKAGKLKLEEVTLEGKVSTIKEDFYQPDPNLLIKGEKQFTFISGLTGYNDYFFDNNSSMNDYCAKKLAGGIKAGYGLTDKLTVNFAELNDYIVSLPNKQDFLNKISLNKAITSLIFSNYKDFNPIQGQTGLLSFYYAPRENLALMADFGISHASSTIDNEFYKINPVGFSSVFSVKYKKPFYSLSSSIFNYSPSFYMAGSSGISSSASYFNDKLGTELSGNINFKKISLNGRVNGYFSNLDKSISGGIQKFGNYDFSARMPINNSSSIDLRQTERIYGNSSGIVKNKNSEFRYNKRLSCSLDTSLTGRINSLNNYNSDNSGSNDYSSNYKTLTTNFNYSIPKKMGNLNLSHDITNVKSNDFNSNYKALSIGYTPPIFKKVTTSLTVGYHYSGMNKGLDFTTSLGYIFDSGKIIQVNYQYNHQLGTFFDDIFIPTSSRHSITFNLSDVFSLIGGNIKSIGSIKEDAGFIKVITFLDSNQNGKKEKDEPEISDIFLNIQGINNNAQTNKKGVYISSGLSEGLYKVNLEFENLPGLLSISPESQEKYLVKVDKNKQTKVYFGLISSVGNISGKVDIKDAFDRKSDIKDLVVTVYNENGEEVKYTNVEADNSYNISGLAPGKYTVQIDKDFIKEYHLEPKEVETGNQIIIPPVYKDYVDIKDINLSYIQIIK